MTSEQLHILQHALGVDQHGQGNWLYGKTYREHFAAGGDDVRICSELIALGYMRQVATTAVFPDFNCRVTDEGRSAVRRESPPPPKLTRSQKRYRDYLKADTGFSFREYLKMLKHQRKTEVAL